MTNTLQALTNRWNRAARLWDEYRCTGTTREGLRCTNPGNQKVNEEWRCWQHGGYRAHRAV